MIQWVDGRLRAWGAWVQMGRGIGSKGLTANWESVGGGGQAGAMIPVQDLEASRTDDWVRTRNREEQGLLLQMYCTTTTARESAATLRMSLRTMYSRLHQVHVAYASRTGPAPVAIPATRAAPQRMDRQEDRVTARVLPRLRYHLRVRSEWARRIQPFGPPTRAWLEMRSDNRRAIHACIDLLRACRPRQR